MKGESPLQNAGKASWESALRQLALDIIVLKLTWEVLPGYSTSETILPQILGKSKESDATNASANTLPTHWSTHYRHIGRHTTDTMKTVHYIVMINFCCRLNGK